MRDLKVVLCEHRRCGSLIDVVAREFEGALARGGDEAEETIKRRQPLNVQQASMERQCLQYSAQTRYRR